MLVTTEQLGGIHLDPGDRELLERRILKLRRRLRGFRPEVCRLQTRLSRNGDHQVRCSMELEVPGREVVACKDGKTVREAIREAGDALVHELEKYRVRLYASLRSRARRARPPEPMPPTGASREVEILFRDVLRRKLDFLSRLAQHEIVHAQMNGDVATGQVAAGEVVDEAVLRVYGELGPSATRDGIERDLTREVLAAARKMISEVGAKTVSLEEAASSQTPEDEVTTLGDEILDFYEPDEELRVEDILPDENSSDPEKVLENREVQRLLYALLARLPEDRRTAFTLVVLEGFAIAEAAMVLGRGETETEEAVRVAEESLARMLSTRARRTERAEVRRLYGGMRYRPIKGSAGERTAALARGDP